MRVHPDHDEADFSLSNRSTTAPRGTYIRNRWHLPVDSRLHSLSDRNSVQRNMSKVRVLENNTDDC